MLRLIVRLLKAVKRFAAAYASAAASSASAFLFVLLAQAISGCKNVVPTSTGGNASLSASISVISPTSNPSSDTNVTFDVGGQSITSYRYTFGASSSTDCSIEANYSSETPISTTTGPIDISNIITYPDGEYKICVVGKSALGWQSFSNASVFTWTYDRTAPTLNLTSLTGGEFLLGGQTAALTWSASDDNWGSATPIAIEYTTNGTSWISITTGTANTGSYNWTAPAIDSSTVKIRITATDASNSVAQDESSTNLTIDSTAPLVTLTNFNGGELLAGGQTYNITWSASDTNMSATPIDLAISTDSGATWNPLATNELNDGTYAWVAPSIDSNTVRLRITATDSVGLIDTTESLADFAIDSTAPSVLSITSTTPNGTYAYGATVNVTINWSENITVTGTPSLQLETGAIDSLANHSSATGATQILTYTVGAYDVSADLNYASTAALTLLAGQSIIDAAGNNATLTLPALASGNSLAGSASLNIWSPVSLTISHSPVVDYGPVSILGTGSNRLLTLTHTSGSVAATSLVLSGLAAPYTRVGGTCSTSLAVASSCTININFDPTTENTFTDTLNLDYNNGSSIVNLTRDLTGIGYTPALVTDVTSSVTDGNYTNPSAIPIQIVFDQVVTVSAGAGSYIIMQTSPSYDYVYYSSGSGTNTLIYNYVPAKTSYSADLNVYSSAITVYAGSIVGTSGYPVDLNLIANRLSTNKNIVVEPWPVAQISNAPSPLSLATALNITITGAHIVSYRHAIVASTDSCTSATYSSETPIANLITDALGADGNYKLCVLGKNTWGTWQLPANATAYQWSKDTTSDVVLNSTIQSSSDDGAIYFSGGQYSQSSFSSWIGGEYPTGYREYGYLRFQLSSAIPAGATINQSYLSVKGLYTYNWNSTLHGLKICAQKTGANASQVTSYTEHPDYVGTTTVLTTTCARWPSTGGLTWLIDQQNISVNISSVIQELVDTYGGLAANNYIQLWITTDQLRSSSYDLSYSSFDGGAAESRAKLSVSFNNP